MCKVTEAIKKKIKEKPTATDLELSTVAVHTGREVGIQIGVLFRVGSSVSIVIGGHKQWFSL